MPVTHRTTRCHLAARVGLTLGLAAVGSLLFASPASAQVEFNTENITTLSNWLAWLALLSCVMGICISAALWAMGSKGQNPGQELTGKKGMILCCTAAFFVGAMPNMLNWLEGAASSADTTGVTGSRNTGGATGGEGQGYLPTNGSAVPKKTNANGTVDGCPGVKNEKAGMGGTSNIANCGLVDNGTTPYQRPPTVTDPPYQRPPTVTSPTTTPPWIFDTSPPNACAGPNPPLVCAPK